MFCNQEGLHAAQQRSCEYINVHSKSLRVYRCRSRRALGSGYSPKKSSPAPLSQFSGSPRPLDRAEVMQWRKAERQRLIGERLAINSDVRRLHDKQIAVNLEEIIGELEGLIVSAPTGPFAVSRIYVALWLKFRSAAVNVHSLQ